MARYYIVCDCSDCPNMREYCSYKDDGGNKYHETCGAMEEKKLRNYPIIPKWCPLQKVKKDK